VAIHVQNPEVCALVKQFAQEQGVSMSQAVKIAVKEALAARADAPSVMETSSQSGNSLPTDIEPA
jgi:hypothetical protein